MHYDVLLNFYYFQPDLIPSMCKYLKPGGILFFETFTTPMLEIKPTINQAHLVNPKEFLHLFPDFDVLYYYDGWSTENSNKDKCHVQLIARKVK